MESIVAEVSCYLDRSSVAVFSRKIDGLVMLAFQRSLHRRVAKLKRLKIVGGSEELSTRAVDRTWSRQVDARLELEQVVRRLGERSRTILALRYAGYTWKEAARLLGSSVSALRSTFWRDVTRVKSELKNHRGGRPEGQAEVRANDQEQSSTSNDAQC
jgi:DNA-directed RNA polymerase specialized sigma24 family protein